MNRRPRIPFLLPLLLAVLAGCDNGPVLPGPATRADFSAELIDLKGRPGPPKGPEGACWQADIRPAVIETVTEQVVVSPERRHPDGSLASAAVFASESHQRILSDRGTVWFRIPCAAVMTPDFLASLQRALKARGLYMQPVTGNLDPATRDAIGRYQRSRGLDSDHLSLAAARELGLVAPDWR